MLLIKSFQCKDLLHKRDKTHTQSTGQVYHLAVRLRNKEVSITCFFNIESHIY